MMKVFLVGSAALTLSTGTVQAAGLLIADGGFGGRLEIREQAVHVTINNGIAVTDVTQVFLNKENRIVEALYTFPVPKGASVSNFSMIINGKEMVGEVVEKERARQIYNSYKQTKRDPGLLEQVDFKRFEMRIFPIPAGAEQHVRVTYCQEVDFDHDWASYVYPLATTTERSSDSSAGRFAVTLDIKSEVPIVETSSPSHADDFVVADHADNYVRASLETDAGDLNRDVVFAYRVERPRTGIDIVTSNAPGDDGYFQLTLTAGKELEKLDTGMDYVFVLDVSGSMAHDGKLGMSRNSLAAFFDGLGEEDRFELITFNVVPRPLFNSTQAVDDLSRSQAVDFLDEQRPRGGTSLRGALETAYRYQDPDRTLNVVLLSDGMTETGEQAVLLDLIRNRPSGSRVFCIGVGNDVNRPLLAQMADEAGGLAAFLSAKDDFRRQAEGFRRKLMRPAASQIKLSFDGSDVYDVEPKQLPSLYHGSPVRVYGRYRNSGPANITVEGDALGTPFRQTATIDLPAVNDDNPEVERMWATHRIQQLLNEARRSGSDAQVKDEIVRLCEGYSVTSEYASFLVLENDQEYKRWQIARRNATRIERDRKSQVALRSQLESMRQKSLAQIGPQDKAAAARSASGQPGPVNTTTSASGQRSTPSVPTSGSPDRGFNIDFPSIGGGGGAIDPITGTIAAILAGSTVMGRRRRRRKTV
jgi:Ca-activated chloride channel family protein